MSFPIAFLPFFPWPVLAGFAVMTVMLCLPPLLARARGAVLRLFSLALLLAVLAGPNHIQNDFQPLPNIALVLVDHSQSMEIGSRNALALHALAALRASAGTTQLDIADIPAAEDDGTSINPTLQQALTRIEPDQLAGVILISDGEIADQPVLPAHVPFSLLLTANGPETDRELRLDNAPAFGLVGQNLQLTFTVIDHGANDAGASANVIITQDGVTIAAQRVRVGQPTSVSLAVRHAGPTVITACVSALPGEVSTRNNQAAFTLTGIQKRLNVLLISGTPDQGERAWRLLLKSDPAIRLVHFTILRMPGEAIDADPQDIALVPFPVQELFQTDIAKFDLIILDGFNAAGLLSPGYLANIAAYVQRGGALFTEVGPEFAEPGSLAFSPLGPVLPAKPAPQGTITQGFSPKLTPLGARDPVTAPFAGQRLSTWYRMEAAAPSSGNVLMTGTNGLPLLVLADAGAGRSGILLSDQLWLWTRGGGHAGPALPLLRRIVHWLLREPALEAETLTANVTGHRLQITRQTLSSTYPGDAVITSPDGRASQLVLQQSGPGIFTGTQSAQAINGVWKIAEGGLVTYAINTPGNAAEYQDLAATDAKFPGLARNIIWLGKNPEPQLQPLLSSRHAVQITGTKSRPLLPVLPALLASLALIVAAWWRENGAW